MDWDSELMMLPLFAILTHFKTVEFVLISLMTFNFYNV